MLSKNKQKYIRQFTLKKHRDAERRFVAEGPKIVGELLQHFRCTLLCATPQFLSANPQLPAHEIIEVSEHELTQISNQKTPQQVLAIFVKPQAEQLPQQADGLILALDGVQDPGNLGTIIRLADWFGIRTIVCSPDTADAYSPKVVQATMGALARVQIYCTPLPDWLGSQPEGTPIYGTHLDGNDLYAQPLTSTGIIIMGNEGKGISPEVEKLVTQKLRIPSYPPDTPTSESLNVAIATAVIAAEFRRRLV